ncbi:class I SAM-dependent methyltransferase [Caldibacillus lycopersici]|uniref:Class I SAM-dependent methyltransferase n=1 Tax=Perspicuibacillus lycopersici TaxID=1325689 RepID=A0AAE3LNJ9_9BACI|nr:class I SAM-dependent methyltransferase [Perspicuibacillus lycopersici]MCU9613946.1 class I SAM-dependent methyltransferase [Perspicuibacillus lycopersici]
MNYQSFAYLYDELMDEAPYDKWVCFFQKQKEKYTPNANNILDLACGTGEMSIRLSEQGYQVTGVDLSEDMLAVANEKAMNKGYRIPFYQQNMTELEGIGPFDIVVIFCDSLNYLASEKEVIETFQSVKRVLKPDGLLLFDVHSTYKIDSVYAGNTFAFNGDDISYIWSSYKGEQPYSIEHELSFFVFDEQTAQYDRYDELHKQQTYTINQYKHWLTNTGFTIQSIEADFGEAVTDTSERIFFTAQNRY